MWWRHFIKWPPTLPTHIFGIFVLQFLIGQHACWHRYSCHKLISANIWVQFQTYWGTLKWTEELQYTFGFRIDCHLGGTHNDVSVSGQTQDVPVPAAPECTPSSVPSRLQHTRPDSRGKMDPRKHIRGNIMEVRHGCALLQFLFLKKKSFIFLSTTNHTEHCAPYPDVKTHLFYELKSKWKLNGCYTAEDPIN